MSPHSSWDFCCPAKSIEFSRSPSIPPGTYSTVTATCVVCVIAPEAAVTVTM